MKCPRDESELVRAKLEEKGCWQCPTCQGYFIGLGGARLKGVALSQLNPKSTPCALPLGDEALISPSSGKVMKHFVYKKINLDYCKSSNSVWMDSGELERVTARSTNRKKTEKATSEYGAADIVADGVFEFIGHAIGSLFDGI